jgi:predicted ATPase
VNLSIHRALAMAHCGSSDADRHDARGLARQNLGYWRASGAETMVPYFLGELAQACHAAGDGTMALDLVNEAIDVAAQNHEHFYDAELYRTRAQVWLARAGDERDAGIADLRRAVEVASQQHAVSFEIRALVALLTVAGELPDRQTCLDELQRALRSLESSEHGTDERTARLLVQQESR